MNRSIHEWSKFMGGPEHSDYFTRGQLWEPLNGVLRFRLLSVPNQCILAFLLALRSSLNIWELGPSENSAWVKDRLLFVHPKFTFPYHRRLQRLCYDRRFSKLVSHWNWEIIVRFLLVFMTVLYCCVLETQKPRQQTYSMVSNVYRSDCVTQCTRNSTKATPNIKEKLSNDPYLLPRPKISHFPALPASDSSSSLPTKPSALLRSLQIYPLCAGLSLKVIFSTPMSEANESLLAMCIHIG